MTSRDRVLSKQGVREVVRISGIIMEQDRHEYTCRNCLHDTDYGTSAGDCPVPHLLDVECERCGSDGRIIHRDDCPCRKESQNNDS